MEQDQSWIPEPNSPQWEFVRFRNGKPTNVRYLRGTTIIEILHKGEKVLFDVSDFATIDFSADKVYPK